LRLIVEKPEQEPPQEPPDALVQLIQLIRLVEGTDLPVRATLRQMNVPRSTSYGWYQRYVDEGFGGLNDKKPVRRPRRNAIPEKIQKQVLDLALERTDLLPRELAWRNADERRYFVS
jgi:putative transposase